MKELYLAMTVLCFLVAVIVYCVNKSIQAMKELREIWKDYKKAEKDIEKVIREFYKEK